MKNNTEFVVEAALIAALYIVLSLLSAALGLASGLIQLRLSEMLCILAMFTPAAIPGLAIGCLVSNILSGCIIWDIIFGSLATLLGAIGTWIFRNKKVLAYLSPVITNSIIIPPILAFAYGIEKAMPIIIISIAFSELLSVVLLGQLTNQIYQKSNK